VGSFVAATGQKPWPSVGSFVAAYGQFFMAADRPVHPLLEFGQIRRIVDHVGVYLCCEHEEGLGERCRRTVGDDVADCAGCPQVERRIC
jgi:hypothetical protein